MSILTNEIALRIKQAREEAGLTLEELASKLSMHKSTIQRYEAGKIETIKLPVVESLASVLNVNPDWLVAKSDTKKPAVFFEKRLMDFDNIHPISTQRIPMLGEIACGKPIFAEEDKESYVLSGTGIKADFCLTARGDSMINAHIPDGAIVFCRSQNTVDNGDIAVVIIDDEATLKRVTYKPEKNLLVLKAENPAFEDLIYQGEELNHIRIMGKAIACQIDVK